MAWLGGWVAVFQLIDDVSDVNGRVGGSLV